MKSNTNTILGEKNIVKYRMTISLLAVMFAVVLCGCGNRNEKALQKGMAKISKGDYKSAVRILEDAAKENPNNASIQCNLGIAYWKLDRTEDAISALKIADNLSTNNSEPLEFIGQIYVEKDKLNEAQLAFKLAAKRNPKSARIITSQAVVEYYRGEFYNCEQLLKQAKDTDSNYAPAQFNLGIMYRSRIGGKTKAEFYFSNYIKIAPNGPRKDIANGFVSLYKESKMPKQETTKEATPAVKITKKETPATVPAKVKPTPTQPQTALAEVEQKLQEEKIDEALILLEQVVAKYPESADALWLQATQYFMLANQEKATRLYNKFRSKFPNDSRIKLIPKIKTATPAPQKEVPLVKQEPKPPNQSRDALASYAFRKANSLYDSKKYDEAIVSYQKALKYDPNMDKALYTLGHIYNGKKEYEQASTYFEKTLQLNSDLIEARYMLAIVSYELNNYTKAKEQLEIAVDMDPFYSKAFFMLGLINRKENNAVEAKQYLKRFVSIAPDSAQAVEAKEWLLGYGE